MVFPSRAGQRQRKWRSCAASGINTRRPVTLDILLYTSHTEHIHDVKPFLFQYICFISDHKVCEGDLQRNPGAHPPDYCNCHFPSHARYPPHTCSLAVVTDIALFPLFFKNHISLQLQIY
jgi:hypothetical protein